MGGFTTENVNYALIPVAIASLIMAVIPLHHESCCSWKQLVPLRSAGAMACTWTALLCMYRHHTDPGTYTDSSYPLFIGWGTCLFLGILGYFYVQYRENIKWMKYLNDNGFAQAISDLENVSEKLFIQDSNSYHTMDNRHLNRNNAKDAAKSNMSVHELDNKRRHEGFTYRLRTANTLPKLAMLLGDLESSIMFERLTPKFISQRLSFYTNLIFYQGYKYLYNVRVSHNKIKFYDDTAKYDKGNTSGSKAIDLIDIKRLAYAASVLKESIIESPNFENTFNSNPTNVHACDAINEFIQHIIEKPSIKAVAESIDDNAIDIDENNLDENAKREHNWMKLLSFNTDSRGKGVTQKYRAEYVNSALNAADTSVNISYTETVDPLVASDYGVKLEYNGLLSKIFLPYGGMSTFGKNQIYHGIDIQVPGVENTRIIKMIKALW
jgi:hypothetical protein